MTAVNAFFNLKKGPASQKEAGPLTYSLPPTNDPVIRAFYAQLTENERIAHAIAVDKLGTSYDVTRTHGFLKWKRKQEQKAKE